MMAISNMHPILQEIANQARWPHNRPAVPYFDSPVTRQNWFAKSLLICTRALDDVRSMHSYYRQDSMQSAEGPRKSDILQKVCAGRSRQILHACCRAIPTVVQWLVLALLRVAAGTIRRECVNLDAELPKWTTGAGIAGGVPWKTRNQVGSCILASDIWRSDTPKSKAWEVLHAQNSYANSITHLWCFSRNAGAMAATEVVTQGAWVKVT